MLVSLEDPRSLDPAVAGAKAAWLARARQAGLPVLPGAVVEAARAQPFLDLGVEQLALHNSGRARMAITASKLPESVVGALAAETGELAEPLIVRSSSVLEGSGVWSGAFTSYLDIQRHELPKAVLGCYASAFTQATVERFDAAGVSPGAAGMAVLMQPAIDAECGGTARIVGGEVLVAGIKGSPVPLVQGWEPGEHARVDAQGNVRGDAAIEALGAGRIVEVGATLRRAQDMVGANSCEWAFAGDELWLLQLQRVPTPPPTERGSVPSELASAQATALARLFRRFPGSLGERFVLPWAIGNPAVAEMTVSPGDLDAATALDEASAIAAALTAEVWGRPKPEAARLAAAALRELRGTDPASALHTVAGLRAPNPQMAATLLGLIANVRHAVVAAGVVVHAESAWHVSEATVRQAVAGGDARIPKSRIGYDRWEPFQASVIAASGARVSGVSAGPGVAAGRMCVALTPAAAEGFRPRDVVVATHPVPGLAALLFDAAALVTTGGGPAAHLFESARALGIPAVCAARIEDIVGCELDAVAGEWALAVDGDAATVHGVEW